MPLGTSIPIYHPFPFKDPLDVIRSLSIQKFLEQPDNDLRLSGIDNQFPFFIAVISQEPLGTHLMLSRFKTPADTPCGVFRNRPAFILCQGRKDCKQNLSLCIQGIDILFFKKNPNTKFFQFPYIIQAVQCISGKPGDGFRNDHINFPLPAVCDHAVEFFSLFCIGCGNAFICIDPGKRIQRIVFDEFRIIIHLVLIA